MYNFNPNYNPFGNNYVPQSQPSQLIRVNGIDGAKAYQLGANSQVALFDCNDDIMFIKVTDGAGFPSIRSFRFSEVNENVAKTESYVTRSEFEELKEIVNGKFVVSKPKSKSTTDAES